jgi:NADH-quinone oxidoreductase subunit N
MIEINSIDFLIVLPELMQLGQICALLVFALCFSYINQSNRQEMKYWAYLVSPTLQTEPIAQLMVFGLVTSAYVYAQTNLDSVIGLETLVWDPLARFMSVLLFVSAAVTISLAFQSFKRFGRYEFLLLVWLSILGMVSLIKSHSFLTFYLSIELQSLSFFMLAAMRSRTEASAEAGLKYFILSAFSSAILLLGMCTIYGVIGSQNFDDMILALDHFSAMFDLQKNSGYLSDYPWGLKGETGFHIETQLIIGFSCICVSLLFKLAAAPLHMWVADVYEGSMTAVTAFFAIVSKIAVATALIRILSLISNPTYLWPEGCVSLLASVGIASLVVGSLSAVRQVKLKRLMAFSSVANVGWFLLALATGQWQLLVLHMMIYIWLLVTLFSVFITPLFRRHPDLHYAQREHLGQRDQGASSLTIKYVSDLHQIYKVNPSLAYAVIVALFSLAGMPPLAGFYSKYLIINELAQNQTYAILAIALATAVLSAFYYVRLIKVICFASSTPTAFTQGQAQWWFTLHPLAINAVLICWTTFITLTWFIKPDYLCVWLALV